MSLCVEVTPLVAGTCVCCHKAAGFGDLMGVWCPKKGLSAWAVQAAERTCMLSGVVCVRLELCERLVGLGPLQEARLVVPADRLCRQLGGLWPSYVYYNWGWGGDVERSMEGCQHAC